MKKIAREINKKPFSDIVLEFLFTDLKVFEEHNYRGFRVWIFWGIREFVVYKNLPHDTRWRIYNIAYSEAHELKKWYARFL